MRTRLLAMTGCLVMSLAATNAFGGSIGPICGTCQGSIYTLTYTTIGTDMFQITYSIDTTGYSAGGTLLDDVAFKVSSANPTNVSLVSAPDGASNWTIVPGGINSGGCDGNGSGFVCAEANAWSFAPSVPGGTYSWVFDLTTTGLFTGTSQASIKARYTNSDGHKVGALVSENITLSSPAVPEPSSLLLLGSGLLAVSLLVRRRLTA